MNVPALFLIPECNVEVRDNVYNRTDCIARHALRIKPNQVKTGAMYSSPS